MKKYLSIILVLLLTSILIITSCGKSTQMPSEYDPIEDVPNGGEEPPLYPPEDGNNSGSDNSGTDGDGNGSDNGNNGNGGDNNNGGGNTEVDTSNPVDRPHYKIVTPTITIFIEGVKYTSDKWNITDDLEGYKLLETIWWKILTTYNNPTEGVYKLGPYNGTSTHKFRSSGPFHIYSTKKNQGTTIHFDKMYKGVTIVQVPNNFNGSLVGKYTVAGVYMINTEFYGYDKTQEMFYDEAIIFRSDRSIWGTAFPAHILFTPGKNINAGVFNYKIATYKDYTKSVIRNNWYFKVN